VQRRYDGGGESDGERACCLQLDRFDRYVENGKHAARGLLEKARRRRRGENAEAAADRADGD